jgi:hypothetical protein
MTEVGHAGDGDSIALASHLRDRFLRRDPPQHRDEPGVLVRLKKRPQPLS